MLLFYINEENTWGTSSLSGKGEENYNWTHLVPVNVESGFASADSKLQEPVLLF